jgi:hypothetical protein
MTGFKRFVVAFAVSGLAASLAVAQAQSVRPSAASAQIDAQDHRAHHPEAEQSPKPAPSVIPAMHDKMMADMQAGDARIESLLAKMKGAKGNAKVDVIAELLTAMAEQHKTMRDGMMQMQGNMMMQMHDQMMKPMGAAK